VQHDSIASLPSGFAGCDGFTPLLSLTRGS
jgi:hypothetical protein